MSLTASAQADLSDRMAALRAQGIHSVLATFTDLNGGVKGKLVPLDLLPQAVADGAGFSGPSITGTGRSEEHTSELQSQR